MTPYEDDLSLGARLAVNNARSTDDEYPQLEIARYY